METRAKLLFKPFPELIAGRRVLELAPFDGWFTRVFLDMQPQEIAVVEMNPDVVDRLSEKFRQEIESQKLTVHGADLHHKIYEFKPRQFDTVICAGFLYHTPHTFWVLEGIARLDAEFVFIETFDGRQFTVYSEDVNEPGCRQCDHPYVRVHLIAPKKQLIDWMRQLGYSVYREIDRSRVPALKDRKLNKPAKDYFSLWLKQYSIWFKKTAM